MSTETGRLPLEVYHSIISAAAADPSFYRQRTLKSLAFVHSTFRPLAQSYPLAKPVVLRIGPEFSRHVGLFDKILAAKRRRQALGAFMKGIRRLEWNPWTELMMDNMDDEDYEEDEDASGSDGGSGGGRWGGQALKDYAVHLSALKVARLDELIVVGMNSEFAESVLDDFFGILPAMKSELGGSRATFGAPPLHPSLAKVLRFQNSSVRFS
jgi:hypothetical protein